MSIERDPEGDEELWIRIYNLQAEVARLKEELSGRHPSYQSALALLFTFVCPEESFDPTQPILMGKRIKDAVARLTGELAAVRRERDEASPYCPTCGSCGEPECCPPSKCKHTICFYGKDYIKDYEMQKEMLDAALARNAALEEAGEAMARVGGEPWQTSVDRWRQVRGSHE